MAVDEVLIEGEMIKDSLEVEEREYHATEFRVIEYAKPKKRETIADIWYSHIVSLSLDTKRLIPIMVLAIPIAIVGLILLSSILWLGLLFVGIGVIFLSLGVLLKQMFLKIIATNVVWEIPIIDMESTKKFMRVVRQYSAGSPKKPQATPVEETIEREEIAEDLEELDDLYEWE